ncbi:uncharacterized protein SCODWIG_01209 [Saccharomycodes ludwigii]|uniref:Uncharacterized protein n=1 Tax=Saccharomycodes ludwigii TaxID=36035 RepID=A0A376B432_9ASCO|nr:hypothetical protein SCDLUD_000809 [Saccharomycodes ludwigii]KAH3903192.1 hypothetical protein SCDLUD_000809 [Saccharomycodes ludwigii]SSD59448.1 uncharacterized protein SCODWIG_01209 [Saccharomycodes ludwigii]
MNRAVSTSSTASTANSYGTLPSLDDSFSSILNDKSLLKECYQYTLKVILLEYINEPRFEGSIENNKENIQSKPIMYNSEQELEALKKIMPKLKKYLNDVAIQKIKMQKNEPLKRSLLKFYNDFFLTPGKKNNTKFEELIMYFSKAANGELHKLQNPNIHEQLFYQLSFFIDLLIKFVVETRLPYSNTINQRLNEYKESFDPKSNKKVTSFNQSNENAPVLKPTFKLAEITHCKYLLQLFGDLNELNLQQDVIKTMKNVDNNIFQQELMHYKDRLLKDKLSLENPGTFPTRQTYQAWKTRELNELNSLIRGNVKPSNTNLDRLIPENGRSLLLVLLVQIMKLENAFQSGMFALSSTALFLLNKCCKIWRCTTPSIKASLLYTATNMVYLTDEEINQPYIKAFFEFINNKLLLDNDDLTTETWCDLDARTWTLNLNYNFNQCMISLKYLITALFSNTKPKFSPVLNIYYVYLDSDPLFHQYLEENDIVSLWVNKKLKRVLYKTTEQYYISLIKQLPRDTSLEFYHIKELADTILTHIEAIQKKYPKPLLDMINLAVESGKILTQAFASDIGDILSMAENNLKATKKKIPITDSIATYNVLCELRGVYLQINKDAREFPFNLEGSFFKYLTTFCDEAADKILQVSESSIQQDKWVPITDDQLFSISVVDIFKMINETFEMFDKMGWENEYQINKLYTLLLKSVSIVVSDYTQNALNLILEDLQASDEPADENLIEDNTLPRENKASSAWIFSSMKHALTGNNGTATSTADTIAAAADKESLKPYEFKQRTCVLLNNLNEFINKLNDLEEKLDPEKISQVVVQYERQAKVEPNATTPPPHQLYTIRVMDAVDIKGCSSDGLSNSVVTLLDTKVQKEFARTQIIRKSVTPVWDEEFELDVPGKQTRLIQVNIWHHHNKKLSPLSKYTMLGKTSILLDPKRFSDDGFPEDITLDLDTQGKIHLQISLENEKLDALFCFGRSYRTLTRGIDRSISLMVDKFTKFVEFSISRNTLKTICGNHGIVKPTLNDTYDAINPLFDYLNSTLNILGSELSRDLLFKIMIRSWNVILKTADELLVPMLSTASIGYFHSIKSKSVWENAMASVSGGIKNYVPRYGRALSDIEMEVVFQWLRTLCIDFFHNKGEGPPMEDLNTQFYRNMMLIPVFYDKSIEELHGEIDRLIPKYIEYLETRNHLSGVVSHSHGHTLDNTGDNKLQKTQIVARKKTIIGNSSRRRRNEIEKQIKEQEQDTLEVTSQTTDVVLRVLLSKCDFGYVQKNLDARQRISKNIAAKRFLQTLLNK